MTQPIGRHWNLIAISPAVLGLVLPFIIIGLSSVPAQAESRPRSPSLVLPGQPSEPATSHPIPRSDRALRSVGWNGPHSAWWLGPVGVVLVVMAFGALSLAKGRGFLPNSRREPNPIEVVGRVNLSNRHAVYLLQVENRTLIVGTGSQGAPALLGELGNSESEIPRPAQPSRDDPTTEARS